MKRSTVVLISLMAFMITLGIFPELNSKPACAAGEDVSLKVGSTVAGNLPISEVFQGFCDAVAERTKNRVKMDYYPKSQLGKSEEQISGVRMGTQAGYMTANGEMARLIKAYQVLNPTFAFEDKSEKLAVLKSPFFDGLRKELEEKFGIVTVFYDWFWGDRQLMTIRPVRKVEDLSGLKLRVPASPAKLYCWKKLGASPTSIPGGEIYMALKQRVVDGVELPISFLQKMHLDEIAKYLTFTNHGPFYAVFVLNKKIWENLSPEDRKIVRETADEYRQLAKERHESENSLIRQSMIKNGVEFIELQKAERAKFLATGRQALSQLESEKKWWPEGIFQKIADRNPGYYKQ